MLQAVKRTIKKMGRTWFGIVLKYTLDAIILMQYKILSVWWHLSGKDTILDDDNNNVCQNVTFIFKSFERQKKAKRLFESIQKFYPNAKVIIADDSRKPFNLQHDKLEIIHLPFNSGLSYGLNKALERVTTPYIMRLDDDLILTPYSKIHCQLRFLQKHPEIDLAAIQMCLAPFLKSPQEAAEEYVKQPMNCAPLKLIIPHMTQIDATHYVVGKAPNVFLARTDKIKEIGYDNNIRMIDHNEFFYRSAGRLVSVMDISAWTMHCHNMFDNHYNKYRFDVAGDKKYIRNKHNISKNN